MPLRSLPVAGDPMNRFVSGDHYPGCIPREPRTMAEPPPASRLTVDPRSGIERRHHLDESAVQRAVKAAVREVRSPLDAMEGNQAR